VVGDIRDYGLDRPARPTFYAYYRQRPTFADSLWFAIQGGGAETAAAARAVVRTIDPDVPPQFLTSEQLYGESLARHRFSLVMLALFGSAAVWLALSGIYGAIAFNVAQRTREIGVRMALGAQSQNVVRMVLRRCFVLLGAGIAGGLLAAFAASRALEPVLYGTASHDPVAYTVATAALLVVGCMAAWLPARHAARVDPLVALRHE
jgi:ABC-type antimicrobial peptide transport system permease subunit